MDSPDLAAITERHKRSRLADATDQCGYCADEVWPCDASLLVAELRKAQEAATAREADAERWNDVAEAAEARAEKAEAELREARAERDEAIDAYDQQANALGEKLVWLADQVADLSAIRDRAEQVAEDGHLPGDQFGWKGFARAARFILGDAPPVPSPELKHDAVGRSWFESSVEGSETPWPGFCQACKAPLNPPDANSCVTCGASDADE